MNIRTCSISAALKVTVAYTAKLWGFCCFKRTFGDPITKNGGHASGDFLSLEKVRI